MIIISLDFFAGFIFFIILNYANFQKFLMI